MRGNDPQQGGMFSYVSPEQRVHKDHPLRPIRAMVDQVLKELSPRLDKMYAKVGRPSIPPEQVVARTVVANAVFGAQRAAAGGRDRLQHKIYRSAADFRAALLRSVQLGREQSSQASS
jgi:hypothetical protein